MLYILIILLFGFANLLISSGIPSNWEQPINLSAINSTADEFAPIWNVNENRLYFNSKRTGKSQFYWSEMNAEEFGKPVLFKSLINNSREDRSYLQFSNDGKIYLTMNRKTARFPVANIAVSEFLRNNWSEPYFIENLQSNHYAAQATISPDGNIMIFVSNKLNNKDTDLFISYKNDDGIWSEPLELTELNSNGNEITPFFYSDSILFYASDGLSGIGGYDIYKAEFYDGIWQRPFPMNDFNTEFDESDFIITPDGTAIFSSNRPSGSGGLDLWQAKPASVVQSPQSISDAVIKLRVSPPEIRITRSIERIIFPLENNYSIEGDYFNIHNQIILTNDGFLFPFLTHDPNQFVLQFFIEYSNYSNTKLTIELSEASSSKNRIEFADKVKRFAEHLEFDSKNINFVLSSAIAEDNFAIQSANNIVLIRSENQLSYSTLQLDLDSKQPSNPLDIIVELSCGDIQETLVFENVISLPNSINLPLEFLREVSYEPNEMLINVSLNANVHNQLSNNASVPIYWRGSIDNLHIKNNNDKKYIYLIRNIDTYEEFLEVNAPTLQLIEQNLGVAKSLKIFANGSALNTLNNLERNLKKFSGKKSNLLSISNNKINMFEYPIPNTAILIVEF